MTLILLTSASTALGFLTAGVVPYWYGFLYLAGTFVGGAAGKFYIEGVAKRYRLTSMLVVVLAFILGISLIVMFLDTIAYIVLEGLGDISVHSVCDEIVEVRCGKGICPLMRPPLHEEGARDAEVAAAFAVRVAGMGAWRRVATAAAVVAQRSGLVRVLM